MLGSRAGAIPADKLKWQRNTLRESEKGALTAGYLRASVWGLGYLASSYSIGFAGNVVSS